VIPELEAHRSVTLLALQRATFVHRINMLTRQNATSADSMDTTTLRMKLTDVESPIDGFS
jgi:hypothetical protein